MNKLTEVFTDRQAVMCDFYAKERWYFVRFGIESIVQHQSNADEGYRMVLYKLEQHLAGKDECFGLNPTENELFCSLLQHPYDDGLIRDMQVVLQKLGVL